MGTPFLAELRIVSFNYPPKGWAFANGQLLPINQNQALFSLLGTTYGGNGISNFALPNLQGLVPMGFGSGGGGSYYEGQTGGEQFHTLTGTEMPAHTHRLAGSPATATVDAPVNNVLATGSGVGPYGPAPGNTVMSPAQMSETGGGQPHENRQPYLTLNVCIALQGIYPSRN